MRVKQVLNYVASYSNFGLSVISTHKGINNKLNLQTIRDVSDRNIPKIGNILYPLPVFCDKKNEKIDFCFVLCSLITTFALDHWHIPQWRAGETFEGKI